MFKTHFLADDEKKKMLFKKYSNILTKIKSLSKKNYFTTKIKEEQYDPRKVRVKLGQFSRKHQIAVKKKARSVKINSNKTSDHQVIANYFHEFILLHWLKPCPKLSQH